jgi:menaquinone-specific isochorismate synthase
VLFEDQNTSFFLLQSPWGLLFSNSAPFYSPTPHPQLPSFYVNDFFLKSPTPWAIVPELQILDKNTISSSELNSKKTDIFNELNPEEFFETFEKIQNDMQLGLYEKIVAAACFKGPAQKLNLKKFIDKAQLAQGRIPYAFSNTQKAILGLSPEILFSIEGNELKTMALAGSAPSSQSKELLKSSKDIREHQIVVDAISKKLAPFGQLSIGDIEVAEFGPISHLKSQIHLKIFDKIDIPTLIKTLHPTPALGAHPWNESSIYRLKTLREKHGIYPEFGAPFGILWGEKAFFLVAIRNILITENETLLSTGCGIIKESRREKEWAEILLKKNAVAQGIGL